MTLIGNWRVAAFPLLAGGLLLPGLVIGPSLDASVFLVTGWRLGHGELPYLDVWDHKPPGIYAVDWLADVLLGWVDPWLAVWLTTVVSVALTGFAVSRLLARHHSGRLATIGGLAVVVGLGHHLLSLGGGLTEQVAVLPATVAFSLATVSGGQRQWLAIGLLLGLAGVISLQLVPAVAACLFLALRQTRLARGSSAAWLVAGMGLVGLLVIVALGVSGAATAAYDAVILYVSAYRQVASPGLGSTAGWGFLSLLFLVIPAAFGVLALRRLDGTQREMCLAAILWIGAAVALVLLAGRLYGHYLAPLAVPLAILAVSGLREIAARGRHLLAGRIATFAVAAGCVLSLGVGIVGGAMEARIVQRMAPVERQVSEFLSANARTGDSLFVWGNQPYLYRSSGLPPAVRFIYLYPLSTPGYASPAMIDAVADGLAQDPPAFVVDAGSVAPGAPGYLPLLMERPVATDGRDLDLLDPLRAFVAERYRLHTVVAGWPVYVLDE